MSPGLLVLVTVLYLGIAVDLAWNERFPLAVTFAGYALANVGLIWALISGR